MERVLRIAKKVEKSKFVHLSAQTCFFRKLF